MKKIILLLTVISVFAACKNNPNPYNKNMVLVDTTGLYKSNAMTDAAKADKTTSTRTWGTNEQARATTHAVYPENGTTTTANTTTSTTTTTPAVPQRDKGWSSAAKGTAIGAGTGAVVGAIVGKNAKGAIIGAIVGGGTGYVIGRSKDRRSGRVERARARKAAGY